MLTIAALKSTCPQCIASRCGEDRCNVKAGRRPGFYLYCCATTCKLRNSAPTEGCYTFNPELIGPLSFFVVAADEAEARETVDS